MQDTFLVTIILIVVCTLAGAFFRGRSRDRCLKSFSGYEVTLEKKDGKVAWGNMRVENSGFELIYGEPHFDEADGHLESSYMLYKSEFGDIRRIVRYADVLKAEKTSRRSKELEKAMHPGFLYLAARKTRNFFGTVRDSLLEVANLFMGRMKSATPAGKLLQGQDKYTAQLQQQLITAAGNAYEPMMENYIGKKVVLDIKEGDTEIELSGILKDYTTEFMEIMDVRYPGDKETEPREADIVIPRSAGIVRHGGA